MIRQRQPVKTPRPHRARSFANRLTQALFYVFLLVVILAPLPLGSNREWSWSLGALLVSGLALAWAVLAVWSPEQVTARPVPALALAFLPVCAWALLQAGGLTPTDWHHPLWQMSANLAAADGAGPIQSSISLSADNTYTAVMRLLCYGLVFFLAFQWGRDRHRAYRAFQWLALAGLAYAMFGLLQFWSGSSGFFWFEDPMGGKSLHSTFVNRNHYATYAGLGLLCALALFYQRVVEQGVVGTRRIPGRRIPRGAHVPTRGERLERFVLQAWKPLVSVLLLSTALILTHSRGGFGSTLLGAFVLLLCVRARRPFDSARSLAVVGLSAGIAVIAFWLTSEVLLQRLDQQGLTDSMRFATFETVFEASQDNPLLGFGYGGFADTFGLYRGDDILGFMDRAHNTYLENIFELGWPAAILLFTTVAAMLLLCVRGVRDRGRDWIYPACGVAATALVGLHSFFDFSLQMPAVAMTYASIMGVACAQSYSSLERRPSAGARVNG